MNATCKIFFFSYEYRLDSVFSGNGRYSRTIVQALVENGFEVTVFCAHPGPNETIEDEVLGCKVVCAGVTDAEWGKLDWTCGFRTWVENLQETQDFSKSSCDIIIYVDWHSIDFISARKIITSKKLCYFPFRVYSTRCTNQEERKFVAEKEALCLQVCDLCIPLSNTDFEELRTISDVKFQHKLIHPPLRPKVKEIRQNQYSDIFTQTHPRKYLLLATRLSPEKNYEVFLDIVKSVSDLLNNAGIIPLVCGSKENQAMEFKQKLMEANSSTVIKGFLNSEELADILSQTWMNIHGALSEPYGMLIIEAAALGAFSMVHHSGIGAVEVLGKENVISVDMSSSESACQAVEEHLKTGISLNTRQQISKQALSYDLNAFGERLTNQLNSLTERMMK